MFPLILQLMVEQGWLEDGLQLLSRSLLAVGSAFLLMLVSVPVFIRLLTKKKLGQVVREDGPRSHLHKTGTPRQAVLKALNMASASDCVLITGRGHESHQIIRGQRLPLNDASLVSDWQRGRGQCSR